MNKRLHTRLALIIIGIAAGIVVVFSVSAVIATHYHFSMYQAQASTSHHFSQLDYHLELALVQTIVWTCLVSILLAAVIGYYVARRISTPLAEMTQVAERMTNGDWDSRVAVRGKDELADLGISLNTLAEQLQRQERLRKTMTEDIAHELRTPLATLKSHMRALEDGVWEPTPQRIHTCYEEIERLTQLVAELEDLNDVESPGFKLVRKEEPLEAIIERGVQLAAAAYREKKVRLRFTVNPAMTVYADHDRMIQILVNLLINALKYTPEQGEVRIHAEDEAEHIVIQVKDSGTGIPPEHLPYIFERFYRGDKSRNRKTGGSGLGLTIVKELVAAHRGQVWAESKDGAAFYIRIPKK